MFGNQNMQNDSNKTIKLILAIGLVVAALVASAGVFYYYVVFVPNLEQQKLDLEQQKMEQERQDALEAKEAEEARIAQEKLDQETKEQQKNLAYSDCLTNAQAVYENNWARNCQSIAERNKVELQNCLNTEYIMNNEFMGERYCKKTYGNTKGLADCSLPGAVAEKLNTSLKERKESCLVEAQNALL